MPVRQIKVTVDGKPVANVLSVNYGLEVAHDADGSPSDARPRLAKICICRKSDDSTQFGDWACKPYKGHFKSGKIEFMEPTEEKKVQLTVDWTDGFIAKYEEHVPDIQLKRDQPMTEYIEVSAQKLKINGIEVDAHTWSA